MAAGHPEAHSTFGVFYLHIDRGASIRIFKEGADMGIPAAMFEYAIFGVLRSGEDISGHRTPKVKKEAFRWAKRAADGGHAEAMWYVALAFFSGETVEKNLREAFRWFLSAANAGEVFAMRYVGYMYFNGDGVRQNRREAYKWFLRAHTAPPESEWIEPDKESAFYLGIMNLWGIGTDRDRTRAKYYIDRAGY